MFILPHKNVEISNDNALWFLIVFWFVELFVIFIYAIYKIYYKDKFSSIPLEWSENPINSLREKMDNTISSETLDLMYSLSHTDISNISSITFLQNSWQGFTIKTPNIKRLSVYIITKLGKSTFEKEELRKTFDYVVENISSDLSKTDFNLVQGKISEFVSSGGEVIINYK